MRTDWHNIFVCKCGQEFHCIQQSVHLTFGFHHLCAGCGEDVGGQSKNYNLTMKTIRWVRKVPFEISKPSTWFVDYVREEKK